MSLHSAEDWIQYLNLQPHPEGGWYRRVYTSELIINQPSLPSAFTGSRPVCTHIYYLLRQNEFSAFHRIQSDELWHFYNGSNLLVYEIDKQGKCTEHKIGNNAGEGESFFCVIKAGNWFAARLKESGSFTLVGCTVSPGFDFAGFELGDRKYLIQQFPEHADLIISLTR